MAAIVVISVVVLVLVWFVWPQRPTAKRPGTDRPGVDRAELEQAERDVQEATDQDSVRDWGPGTGQKPPPELGSKRNIVPNPSYSGGPSRPVAPAVVQASPGATTTLVTRQPAPPSHQQAGMPKITATPGFVDSNTLLPKRGPQGAGMRPAASAPPPPSRP